MAAQESLTLLLNALGDEAKITTREASEIADKTLLIRRRLYWATIWLVVLTVLLLIVTLGLFRFEFQKHYQEGNAANHANYVQGEKEAQEVKRPVDNNEAGLSLRSATTLTWKVK